MKYVHKTNTMNSMQKISIVMMTLLQKTVFPRILSLLMMTMFLNKKDKETQFIATNLKLDIRDGPNNLLNLINTKEFVFFKSN